VCPTATQNYKFLEIMAPKYGAYLSLQQTDLSCGQQVEMTLTGLISGNTDSETKVSVLKVKGKGKVVPVL